MKKLFILYLFNNGKRLVIDIKYMTVECWRRFFIFLKSPYLNIEKDVPSEKLELKELLFHYLLYLLVLICISALLAIADLILAHHGINLLKNVTRNNRILRKNFTNIEYVILGGVMIPIYEEIIFRNYLKLNKLNIAISLSTYIFFFYGPIFPLDRLFSHYFLLRVLYTIGAFVLVEIFIKEKWVKLLGQKYFRYVFYFSAILFGGYHIINFSPLSLVIILFSPILIFPQLFLGCLLGYIRIKSGLRWSIALHILINTIAILLGFI